MIKICVPKFYGHDSNTLCAQCRGDDVCNPVSGECPRGCKQHWAGLNCDGA